MAKNTTFTFIALIAWTHATQHYNKKSLPKNRNEPCYKKCPDWVRTSITENSRIKDIILIPDQKNGKMICCQTMTIEQIQQYMAGHNIQVLTNGRQSAEPWPRKGPQVIRFQGRKNRRRQQMMHLDQGRKKIEKVV